MLAESQDKSLNALVEEVRSAEAQRKLPHAR
jgi:hypothetical protein